MNKLTFDDVDELVAISQEPLENRYLEIGNEKGEPHYRFLYYLVHATKPKLCLEIGVGWGLGSAHLCVASSPVSSEHSHVAAIDFNITVLVQGLYSFYGNYHFVKNDSVGNDAKEWIALLVEMYGPIGIVFQDSSHHYDASCKEWDIYSQFLDENAIWVCDDITPAFQRLGLDAKSMVGYFEERPGEKKLYDNLHLGSVIGVIIL